jgi:septum formation protein
MPRPASVRIVLASTSAYRRELLARLRIPFQTASPEVNEARLNDETPRALAARLAAAKATAVQPAWPNALIIGSDQVAVVDDAVLPKPGDFLTATRQLRQMRARPVHFYTAVCLLNSRTLRAQSALVLMTVHMRDFSDAQIERYLHADKPYDCAGSARIEALGISLVARLSGDDPTALIGLPLIALCDMLRNEGVDLP